MSNEDPVQDEAAQPDAPEGAAPSDVTEAPADAAGDAGPEAVAEPPAEATPEAPPEKTLEEKLEESKAATAAMKEKMLRVAADFENYRRRSTREVDDARKRGVQHAVRELLPVFDNLERATTHIGPEADAKSMADGLRMVLKQFIDVIAKVGVERVEAVGSPFDPNVHESIQYEHSEEHAAGTVMKELQPGYKMGDMLLRPALVVVSRGAAVVEEAKAEAPAEVEGADSATDEAPEPPADDAAEGAPEEDAKSQPPAEGG